MFPEPFRLLRFDTRGFYVALYFGMFKLIFTAILYAPQTSTSTIPQRYHVVEPNQPPNPYIDEPDKLTLEAEEIAKLLPDDSEAYVVHHWGHGGIYYFDESDTNEVYFTKDPVPKAPYEATLRSPLPYSHKFIHADESNTDTKEIHLTKRSVAEAPLEPELRSPLPNPQPFIQPMRTVDKNKDREPVKPIIKAKPTKATIKKPTGSKPTVLTHTVGKHINRPLAPNVFLDLVTSRPLPLCGTLDQKQSSGNLVKCVNPTTTPKPSEKSIAETLFVGEMYEFVTTGIPNNIWILLFEILFFLLPFTGIIIWSMVFFTKKIWF